MASGADDSADRHWRPAVTQQEPQWAPQWEPQWKPQLDSGVESDAESDADAAAAADADAEAARRRRRWPDGQVPVEIFELIIAYLSRAEIKNLRLVCREFESKVSAQYFRNVVVPFRAELYSGHDGSAARPNVFSDGMRIFRAFGPHILRFALSLEIDEDSLALPPVKTVHKAVPAFWGIYRWPHDVYCRYQDLEGMERTADETGGMKQALRCLSKARNLGLCCDAGLGFLCGPDKTARNAIQRHPVFAAQDWRRKQLPPNAAKKRLVVSLKIHRAPSHDAPDAAYSRAAALKRAILAQMISDAGYAGPHQINEAVRVLLATEGATVASIDLDGRSHSAPDQARSPSSSGPFPPCPLVPCDLTVAQMEMLLELEWAHRAMIQSYVIGLIDNASSGCFSNVTTLTIAKIPSSHLHILCRDDLWDSIPSLKNVSLGVIADWRRISAPSPGFVEDKPVSPVKAVGPAFTLLNSYIGKRANIESIHFEWICGGELAPGLHHRNMYILPAPFFETPDVMSTLTGLLDHSDQLLALPHAMHLSLKNCWVSPHVLLQAVRRMALASLEKLELETVSLSGPPTLVLQAPLVQLLRRHPNAQGAIEQSVMFEQDQDALPDWLGLGPTLPQPTVDANGFPAAGSRQLTLTQPELLSWPGIIEHLSPGVKIQQLLAKDDNSLDGDMSLADLDAVSTYLPDAHRLRSDQECYQLKSLSFKSCGYAAVDLPFLDSRAVMSANAASLPSLKMKGRPDLARFMQRSGDKMLGLIISHISRQDLVNLETGFGMTMGWDGVYNERVIDDAIADGMVSPGLGRFSGMIESDCRD